MEACSVDLLPIRGKSIMQFYGERTSESGENHRYKCKLCSSDISSSKKATSNLVKHVQRKHAIEFAQYKMGSPTVTRISAPSQSPHLMIQTQNAGPSFVKSSPKPVTENDLRDMAITDALVQLIAGSNLSLPVIDSPDFRIFVGHLDPRYPLPSQREICTNIVPHKSQVIEEKLKAYLSSQEDICLTFDMWSCHTPNSILAVTAHFIDNWKLRSALLACRNICQPHDNEIVIRHYEEIIEKYYISSKVKCIITDNAANKATAHNVKLPGCENFQFEDALNDEERSEIVVEETSDDVLYHLPLRISCFTYVLQQVVKDGLQDCKHLEITLSKMATLANTVQRTPHADLLLGDSGRVAQIINTSRWNFQLKVLRSILRIPEDIFYVAFNHVPGDGRSLTALDRAILSELVQVLEPFEDAMDFIEGDHKITVSSVLPSIRGLRAHLQAISPRYCHQLVARLREAVDRQLIGYEKSDVFALGAILDPRFKLAWCTADEVDYYKGILRKELLSKTDQFNDRYSPCEQETKRPKLFNYMSHGSQPSCSHGSKEEKVIKEMTKYFSATCLNHSEDPLLYWQKMSGELPLMAKIAQSALAVCASSAPIEQIFTVASKFHRMERNSYLLDEMFESLMLIKSNFLF